MPRRRHEFVPLILPFRVRAGFFALSLFGGLVIVFVATALLLPVFDPLGEIFHIAPDPSTVLLVLVTLGIYVGSQGYVAVTNYISRKAGLCN